MLKIVPSTSNQRALLFIETLLNETDIISKVSKHSVNSGIAAGIGKVSGVAEKDIILALGELFPDNGYGTQLDNCAARFGYAPRFGATSSSTYIRIVADPGTVYDPSHNTFGSTTGLTFELSDTVTVGDEGFTYALVTCTDVGAATNIPALSITQVSPQPVGHKYVINEFKADYGQDNESDDQMRARLKNGPNILARGTLAMLTQVFMSINPKVLRSYYRGISANGAAVISIVTQDGSSLDSGELKALTVGCQSFLSLTESQPFGTTFTGLELRPVQFQPIDISFRVLLDGSVSPDDVRIAIQAAIGKYLDFRNFNPLTSYIQWTRILEIIQNTPGVQYVPDRYFYPLTDIAVNSYLLPRLRGFLMLDLDGNIIQNFSGTLSPIYYPSQPDFSYQSTVLQNI